MRIAPCLLAALALLPALSACDGGGPASPADDASSFVASVSGSVRDTYRGEGRFHVHAGVWEGIFSITSLARGNSDAQIFSLFKLGTAAPAPGRYALTGAASPNDRQPHFAAQYLRRSGAFAEGFTAVEGELQITVATAQRVEGTFRFRGVRNCMGPPQEFRCSRAYPPDLSQPAVEVTGSFAAVPGEEPAVVLP